MKVFVRTSELHGKKPVVLAFYRDDIEVNAKAHGEGTTMLTVPMSALVRDPIDKLFYLAEDWQQRAGPSMLDAEVKRRIEEIMPISEQISTLHETVNNIIKHGADHAKWPLEARGRKAEIDELWNYVAAVKERARAHAPNIPRDPGSDKIWPPRIAKKRS
jgi:hypothetical protein